MIVFIVTFIILLTILLAILHFLGWAAMILFIIGILAGWKGHELLEGKSC